MKKTFKYFVVIMAIIMAMPFALTACGSSEEASDDGQNPVMNFVGNYQCDRANVLIEADGDENARATVTWGGSAWETGTWVMSGAFDSETLTFEYSDCVSAVNEYDKTGELSSTTEKYTNGKGSMTFAEGDPLTLTWQDDEENVADGMVFEYVGAETENGEVGIPNPWDTAKSSEEAAKGAGIDSFTVPESTEISLGKVDVAEYRYMDTIAEADVEFPAVEMTIRKGTPEYEIAEGDISGDYGEYKYDWTVDVDGQEVTCFGNREGEATKTIWTAGEYNYSITAVGLGGDDDYGLPEDDVKALVSGIK